MELPQIILIILILACLCILSSLSISNGVISWTIYTSDSNIARIFNIVFYVLLLIALLTMLLTFIFPQYDNRPKYLSCVVGACIIFGLSIIAGLVSSIMFYIEAPDQDNKEKGPAPWINIVICLLASILMTIIAIYNSLDNY